VTRAAPHHLEADAGVRELRRTRAGDRWEAERAAPGPVPPARRTVGLGMPALRSS
jgi:tRNA-2-methylthio-N6-dimethylallyladenosine synthase